MSYECLLLKSQNGSVTVIQRHNILIELASYFCNNIFKNIQFKT